MMGAYGNKSLRIVYAAGPGDVIGTYRHWKEGHDDPSQVNLTLSGMFYDECRAHGDKAYILSTCAKVGKIHDGNFVIEQRPQILGQATGLLYHVGQVLAAIRLIWACLWFQADVLVIVCGTCHWFPLRLLPLLGVDVVASLHCVPWLKYQPIRPIPRLIRRLSGSFFASSVSSILSMSEDISDQVKVMTHAHHRRILPFLPTYRPQDFSSMQPPDFSRRPFRVFFAGRIEWDKGVFDLLQIAERFKAAGVNDVIFDICGRGGAFDVLKAKAEAVGVGDRLLLHGYCDRPKMREMFEAAHVVIVPTRSNFVEGFNQVVSEAVLAGRPVITSAVCPAIQYVGDAAYEVPVDNADAYGDAILALLNDPELYRRKAAACAQVSAPFYDLSRGWGTALRQALDPLRAKGAVPMRLAKIESWAC
jgi:glycosyltransferase involved in cell wall biosynthesis